ncbi:MAG: putative metallopeptidase [Gemmataceae bacterium]|nr:putative metallopeptidase [Gemmataceae bacterium]MDW8264701.1 putative metallopeptidase [Gemmataceae bacterium]
MSEDHLLPVHRPPFVLHWDEATNPLPVRTIRGLGLAPAIWPAAVPPYYPSGPIGQPFDFCGHIRRLCADIVARCDELRHIDVNRLLFAVTQARSNRRFGLQARVTPLRFRDGRLIRRRRGVPYQVQRYFIDGQEILYLITFCLPRFLDQDFDDKFITLFHELYHISPAFDGDLRRHQGRYSIHSRSQKKYDAHMAHLARTYLRNGADPALHGFLRLNFAQLQQRHGSVLGVVVPRPKLLPLPAAREN